PVASLMSIAKQPRRGDVSWFISFPRVKAGIPYREQFINVSLQAESGEVEGLTKRFTTPPAAIPSEGFRIDAGRAASLAAAVLKDHGLPGLLATDVHKEFVQPNTLWKPGGSELVESPTAAPAWVCAFTTATGSRQVWIDPVTGGLLGGMVVMGRLGSVRS
ncbi:MAG: hypothetical protein LC772_05280, partial [Chloroflexi bacterium]|nr:hypothetical protein [Chloroflexota bacterium]